MVKLSIDGNMNFLERADAEINRLQDLIENDYEDADCTRSGNVLSIDSKAALRSWLTFRRPLQEILARIAFGRNAL